MRITYKLQNSCSKREFEIMMQKRTQKTPLLLFLCNSVQLLTTADIMPTFPRRSVLFSIRTDPNKWIVGINIFTPINSTVVWTLSNYF